MRPLTPGPECFAVIRRFEGLRLQPYLCPSGYWTIGYGHRLGESAGSPPPAAPVTQEEVARWLQQDVNAAHDALMRLTQVTLSQPQVDALCSFIFNLGPAAFQRSALRRAVNRGAHHDAAQQFSRWVWADGRKLPGLVARRQAEAALYRRIPPMPGASKP